MPNLQPNARLRRGRSRPALDGSLAVVAIAVLVLACATSATASERRARLSSDLKAHLDSSSPAPIDVIVSGSQERIDRLARRHGLVVKKVLSSGAVLTASTGALAALAQDVEVDALSGDSTVRSHMAVTASTTGADAAWSGAIDTLGAVNGRGVGVAIAQLTGESEISLGERLSGWVAAHRTPICNSDTTLDLPGELAKSASIGLASSVPLVDGDVLSETVALYSPAGAEIDIEQRVLIQSIALLLATALSTHRAHHEIVAVDCSDRAAREAAHVVLDVLLSNLARVTDRTNPDAISIVLVGLPFSPGTDHHPLLNSLRAGLSSTAGATETVIRPSPIELLITARVRVLSAIGIDGSSATKSGTRSRYVRVREITNSLQLQEVLGLTQTGEPAHTGKPVVH